MSVSLFSKTADVFGPYIPQARKLETELNESLKGLSEDARYGAIREYLHKLEPENAVVRFICVNKLVKTMFPHVMAAMLAERDLEKATKLMKSKVFNLISQIAPRTNKGEKDDTIFVFTSELFKFEREIGDPERKDKIAYDSYNWFFIAAQYDKIINSVYKHAYHSINIARSAQLPRSKL